MEINVLALVLAVISRDYLTPEIAFERLESGATRRWQPVSADDTDDMIRLKAEGYTYHEIGAIYGNTGDAVYNRIRRRKGII